MKQKKKVFGKLNVRIVLSLLVASIVLAGCQGTKSVPEMEKLANMEDEKISEKLGRFSREELVSAWGEPEYDLFGDGDLFVLNKEGNCLCVYYEEKTGKVKHAYWDMGGGIQDFTGTIEEDYESTAVVRVDDNGYSICGSGDLVYVDLTKGEELLDVEVGDKVYVEYIGGVMESMPLQLQNQLTLSVIESAGSFDDVDDALLEVGTLDGVTVELLEVMPTSAKLGILNTTDQEVIFGEDYNLQMYEDGEWKDVPYLIDNWGFHSIGYMAPKNQRVEWDVDWTAFHGELGAGKYRIVKSIMDFRGTGDYTNYYYTVEFEIAN